MIAGARIWDATGAPAFAGDPVVEGDRIATVSRASGRLAVADAQMADACGLTPMSGMVEGHAHLSFEAVTSTRI